MMITSPLLTGNVVLFTYESKIAFALAGCNYFDKATIFL